MTRERNNEKWLGKNALWEFEREKYVVFCVKD